MKLATQEEYYQNLPPEDTYHDECLDCGHVGMNFKGQATSQPNFVTISSKRDARNTKPVASFWGIKATEIIEGDLSGV